LAYFQDMTVCTYFPAPATSEWACRLMAIGWVEAHHEFSTGFVNPRFLEKVALLRREFNTIRFPDINFRGLHACSLCANNELLGDSHVNLFIPTSGFVYVSPARIDHYVETHRYAPPEHFVEAVIQCPSPMSVEYRAAMSAANRGYEAPLFRDCAQ
jgi:hypothetical protein